MMNVYLKKKTVQFHGVKIIKLCENFVENIFFSVFVHLSAMKLEVVYCDGADLIQIMSHLRGGSIFW